eukprot:9403290-Prorocentrum_lima.AAC.1
MYLCARQYPLLEWRLSAVNMVHDWVQSKGSVALLKYLDMSRRHAEQPIGPEEVERPETEP